MSTYKYKCFLFLQVDTVCHGDELPLLFHANLTSLGGTYTDKELTLVKEMQGYWANFAKQGAPASSGTYKSVLLDSVCSNPIPLPGVYHPPHYTPDHCFVVELGNLSLHHQPHSCFESGVKNIFVDPLTAMFINQKL